MPKQASHSRSGGPYRDAAESPEPAPSSVWPERVTLGVLVAPWLVPLWQALRGSEPFGWSATIGLVASLTLLARAAQAASERLKEWSR